jgi:hypothetical protein
MIESSAQRIGEKNGHPTGVAIFNVAPSVYFNLAIIKARTALLRPTAIIPVDAIVMNDTLFPSVQTGDEVSTSGANQQSTTRKTAVMQDAAALM